jgi:Fe2+ or Zn2+ uptake regulation protein
VGETRRQKEAVEVLREHGIQPSAQRVAVAEYVLFTDEHPSAEKVWATVHDGGFPMLSRATVYNTLNLFVKRGLIRQLVLAEGKVVFDPNLDKHHHFIDETSGEIHDVPWEACHVSKPSGLKDYVVREYSVVMRGKKRN